MRQTPNTKPSAELEELIHFENLMPLDFVVEDVHSFNIALKSEASAVEKIERITAAGLPLELQNLISEERTWQTLENYYSLVETLNTLRDCAKYLEWEIWKIENYKNSMPEEQEMVRKSIEFNRNHFARKHRMFDFDHHSFQNNPLLKVTVVGDPYMRALPTFDRDYTLEYKSSYLMTVLRGIDVRRLRTCVQCQHVYWAYRLNQTWCSKRCSNAHHQKTLRSDSRRLNKVNEDRRKNYAYKQDIKKRNNSNPP